MVAIIVKLLQSWIVKSIPTSVNVVIPKNILHNIGSYLERDLALPATVSGVV